MWGWEGGRHLPWVRAGGRIWTEGEGCVRVRPGRNSMEKTARELKKKKRKKERVGVCWRERLVGIKALPLSLALPYLLCHFLGGVCVRVCLCIFWKGREECVCACGLITLPRMHQLLVATLVLVALCSLGSVDSSAYDKIVTHSRIRARKEG